MNTYTIEYTDSNKTGKQYQVETAPTPNEAKTDFYYGQQLQRGTLDGITVHEIRPATEAEAYLGSQLIMSLAGML